MAIPTTSHVGSPVPSFCNWDEAGGHKASPEAGAGGSQEWLHMYWGILGLPHAAHLCSNLHVVLLNLQVSFRLL